MLTTNNLFDNVWKNFFMEQPADFKEAFPPTNLYTTDKECVIQLALAGYKKEDLYVSVKDDTFEVGTVESFKVSDNKDTRYYINRIKTMPFKREYTVIADYDVSKAKASFEDGLLTIAIPVKEKAKPKTQTLSIL